MADTEQTDITTLAVQLLSAYVANNKIESSDLAALIQSTRAALIDEPAATAAILLVINVNSIENYRLA